MYVPSEFAFFDQTEQAGKHIHTPRRGGNGIFGRGYIELLSQDSMEDYHNLLSRPNNGGFMWYPGKRLMLSMVKNAYSSN